MSNYLKIKSYLFRLDNLKVKKNNILKNYFFIALNYQFIQMG